MPLHRARRAFAPRALWTLAAWLCVHGLSPARADTIALPQALARTVAESPELVASGHQLDAARGRLLQAELGPNPELSVTLEDAFGTGAHRGARLAETTITLDWVLERGVRERFIDVGRADIALRESEAAIARLEAAAETGRLFVTSLTQQARLELAQEAVTLAEETVAAAERRVAAGAAPRAELARARAELARTELTREDLEHELRTSHQRLAAQWGERPPGFTAVRGQLETLPAAEPFAALLDRAARNPELARFAAQRRLDEAELRLAEARRRPRWTASIGMRRYEGPDDVALVAGIHMPLPVRDRNQGRIAEARADLLQTDAAARAARLRMETTLFALHQELEHHMHVAEALRDEVIPLFEDALEETRRAYEIGRYGYLERRAAQTELLEAREALLEASGAAHGLVIEIERLTGVAAVLGPARSEERP